MFGIFFLILYELFVFSHKSRLVSCIVGADVFLLIF